MHQLADEMGFDEDEFAANRNKAGRGKKNVGGKQKGDAAFEDSDDGDGEGDEVDYMSDDSSDFDVNEDDKPELKGINEDLSDREVSSSSGEEEEEDEKKETQEQEVSFHHYRIHSNACRTRTNQMSKIQTLKTSFQNPRFSNSATSKKPLVLQLLQTK